jgi:AbrB family looped-hinge helix DNA binding protein
LKELRARVSSKGQVTIPSEVRDILGVQTPGDVAFLVENGEVRMARRGNIVERTAGMLQGPGPRLSAGDERAAAERAIAEEVVERSR